MGHIHKYTCNICNYEFEGSGGRDSGKFSVVYDTYNCLDCKKTFDYCVEDIPGTTIKEEIPKTFSDKLFFRKQEYRYRFTEEPIPLAKITCDFCKGNNVVLWNHTCPRCDSEMKLEAFIGMWD